MSYGLNAPAVDSGQYHSLGQREVNTPSRFAIIGNPRSISYTFSSSHAYIGIPGLSPSRRPNNVRNCLVSTINANGNLHSLSKPVVLKIKNERGTYIAENDFFGICGHGDTESEAFNDAVKELTYCYEYYRRLNENDVIGHGLTIRNRFLSL